MRVITLCCSLALRPASTPGVVSLLADLRGHERRAAEELGQRKTRVEERKGRALAST